MSAVFKSCYWLHTLELARVGVALYTVTVAQLSPIPLSWDWSYVL
jgi:hypothetical protein